MFKTISRYATWDTLRDDIAKYISGCTVCQEDKPKRGKQTGQLHPHEIPPYPWHMISVDMIGPLPESKGNDAILTIIDKRTKHPILVPTTTTLSSEGWARILLDHVFKRFGLPRYIISDRGSIFVSKFIKEWYDLLGIKGHLTTAYHPQADGQTERMNQEVEIFLRHFINHRQDDWSNWLSLAEFSIANRTANATKVSPFLATQGQHPWTGNPIEIPDQFENESVETFITRLANINKSIDKSSLAAQRIMKEKYDKHRKPVEYKKGQKVWLNIKHFTSERSSKKLDHKRYGPFEIEEQHRRSSYRLKLPKTWKIFPIFNEILLTPYIPPSFPSQEKKHLRPPPEIIDNDEEYEIEEILDSCIRRNKLYYLVHWLGYARDEDSWIPATETDHCQDLVKAFHKAHPCAPTTASLRYTILTRSSFTPAIKSFPEDSLILAIYPKNAEKIRNGTKNHEYRKYPLPHPFVWLYKNEPINAITTILRLGSSKAPGEVKDPSGDGNDDYDNGLKDPRTIFGYLIINKWTLPTPITADILNEKYNVWEPRRYSGLPAAILADHPPNSWISV
jgi:Chromo (CHRromatin Organisation MOdifier) domain/Integrase core domain